MNGRYYVEKALKEAKKSKNHDKIADVLVKYFDQAIEHTVKEADEALHAIVDDCEHCKAKLRD